MNIVIFLLSLSMPVFVENLHDNFVWMVGIFLKYDIIVESMTIVKIIQGGMY